MSFWPQYSAPFFSDCFGVLDCEWCMVDSDGKTHLDKPYCALQKECFGGIVGAKSPYADGLGLLGESWNESYKSFPFVNIIPLDSLRLQHILYTEVLLLHYYCSALDLFRLYERLLLDILQCTFQPADWRHTNNNKNVKLRWSQTIVFFWLFFTKTFSGFCLYFIRFSKEKLAVCLFLKCASIVAGVRIWARAVWCWLNVMGLLGPFDNLWLSFLLLPICCSSPQMRRWRLWTWLRVPLWVQSLEASWDASWCWSWPCMLTDTRSTDAHISTCHHWLHRVGVSE